jgi:hypothetical protein
VDIRPALTSLSNALSHLQFEGSDPASDEIVLFRMLAVIDACITSEVGAQLGDVEVCELLEAVLTICCQMRRSGTRAIFDSIEPEILTHFVSQRYFAALQRRPCILLSESCFQN